MNRISTADITNLALLDLRKAQAELQETARQSSSQKKADDALGFGQDTQWLILGTHNLNKIDSQRQNLDRLQNRLEMQDLSLGHAATAISKLKQDIMQVEGMDKAENIAPALEQAFSALVSALNLQHNGRWLFSGIADDRSPLTATEPEALLVSGADGLLEQDNSAQIIRLDGRLVAAAPLAREFAAKAFDTMHELAIGAFTSPMDSDQKQLLQTHIQSLGAAHDEILQAQADNGRRLQLAETAHTRLDTEHNILSRLIGERTNVDLAEIATRLSQAQMSYQASASVFNRLRELSLLDIL